MREQQLPPFYQPEPFLVSEPATTSRNSFQGGHGGEAGRISGYSASGTDERPQSRISSTEIPASSIAASSRKSGAFPRPMRPVNIIQHDDAGPSESGIREDEEDEPETIELPPAYTNIKK
jgi:hypothetical protein